MTPELFFISFIILFTLTLFLFIIIEYKSKKEYKQFLSFYINLVDNDILKTKNKGEYLPINEIFNIYISNQESISGKKYKQEKIDYILNKINLIKIDESEYVKKMSKINNLMESVDSNIDPDLITEANKVKNMIIDNTYRKQKIKVYETLLNIK
jgi:hypothetical protein